MCRLTTSVRVADYAPKEAETWEAREMETRPLGYYMGLDYTVEVTREQGTLVAEK